jgi:hypothetical protein
MQYPSIVAFCCASLLVALHIILMPNDDQAQAQAQAQAPQHED